jgi:hypothetical protein
MTATNKLRVATIDTPHAIDIACSVVFSAVGLAVQAELQEIERGSLIIEFNSATSRFTRRTLLDWPPLSTRLQLT